MFNKEHPLTWLKPKHVPLPLEEKDETLDKSEKEQGYIYKQSNQNKLFNETLIFPFGNTCQVIRKMVDP